MRVMIIQAGKEVDLQGCSDVQAVLAKLAINPETVLVLRDGKLITKDERIAETDRIEILPVISGGGPRIQDPE
ncbi:MAG: MoaD/ThiS family protein [Terriglobia bacterium]